MSHYEALREQAVALRKQGYSHRQIAEKLGLQKGTISRWVADVPFDGFNEEAQAEQLARRRDPNLYNRAIELRQQGWSYNMIMEELGVAKSTLSGWLRDVEFDEYHPAVEERVANATKAMADKYASLREAAREEARAEMAEFLADGISDRELFLIGLMLYWGEGSKTRGKLSLTNSSPRVIQLFILWLEECLNVTRDRLRGEVHLYPDVDIEEAEAYWSMISGIPFSQFYPAQIDTRQEKLTHKKGKLQHGTFHVKVRGKGVTYLHVKVLTWIRALGKYLSNE